MRQVRRGLVAVGLIVALMPLSAFAEDGNQAAIDAAKAEKAWLQSLPAFQQGVVFGQREIANAKAMAKMMTWSSHAQAEIPNSMQQYTEFCAMAIVNIQANLVNAQAMAANRPWDPHAQAEVANASAHSHMLWDMIGETYPGNPYYSEGTQVRSPSQYPVTGDEQYVLASTDDEDMVMAGDEAAIAADAGVAADDSAEVATTS